jgi:hypothetical protein
MTPPEVIVPMININGTPAAMLITGYLDAIQALHQARAFVAETAPHGRDYANTDLLRSATQHHRIRIEMIDQIIDDFAKIGVAIADEVHKRRG